MLDLRDHNKPIKIKDFLGDIDDIEEILDLEYGEVDCKKMDIFETK